MAQHTKVTIKGTDGDLIIMAAMRYAMGRRTYIVNTVVEFLINNWDKISDSNKNIIKRDLEEAIELDDADRARLQLLKENGNEEGYMPTPYLGDNCDRVTWDRLRALWINKEDNE